MKFLLLLASLSVVYQLSSGEVIGYDNPKQELFLYRQKLTILYNVIDKKCPDYIGSENKRASEHEIPFHLSIAKQLYNKLIKKLIECEAELKAAKSFTAIPSTTTQPSATSTQPTTTTTQPTTTTTQPSTTTTTQPTTTTTHPTTTTTQLTTTTTQLTTTTTEPPKYKDCQEFYVHGYRKSGVYEINLPNLPSFDVWCDFFGNRGWTVIQRRENDGNVSFERKWTAYKQGFGTKDAEYWLGNDNIHALTTTNQKLNIQLVLSDGSQKSGYWTKFYISDESDNYRLTIDGSGYTGDLVDKFSNKDTNYEHNGMAFSTLDRDNDRVYGYNCAAGFKGGWWYNACGYVLLNNGHSVGMHWAGDDRPLRSSVMRVTR